MTAVLPQAAPESPAPAPAGQSSVQLRRVAVGLLVIGLGVAMLLDNAGVDVPWHLLPAVGVVAVGLTLLAAAARGQRTGGLLGLGLVLVVLAAVAGSGARDYAGPFGDRRLSPTVSQWPVEQRLTAGSVVVDLTEHPLPGSGRLDVRVGAGEIVLRLPSAQAARVVARVSLGEVTVDGRTVENGVGLRWSGGPEASDVRLDLRVGTGNVRITYARATATPPSD